MALIYVADITVPANTPESDPEIYYVELEGVWLRRIQVVFPPGCARMVKVKIMYGIYQLAPRPYGSWLAGDDEKISVEINKRLPDTPTRLKIITHSEGTTYSHTITFRFWVLEKYSEHPYIAMSELIRRLDVLLKRIGAW